MNVTMQTGPVFTIWHGGTNYAPSGTEHVERFETVEDAAIESENRLKCPSFANTFRYLTGEETCRTPLVDEENSYVEVFLTHPELGTEPDAVLSYDPDTDD